MGVLVRLGLWQLDRLEKRRPFNARASAAINAPPLALKDEALQTGAGELAVMEYRAVQVSGEYDHSHQIAVRSQYWQNQLGVHLITPLQISGSDQFVLVDRGWISAADFESGDWSQFDEPGPITVHGVIRQSRTQSDYGTGADPTPAPGEAPRAAWNFVNIPVIQQQMPFPLLPIYIQQAPAPDWTKLPHRSQPEVEVSEGPHMGYALQWFSFAILLGLGYPFFIRRQERRSAQTQSSIE